MKLRSQKSYHIVRRVVKKGTRPPRVLNQLGIGKYTTGSATSSNENLNGHQARVEPNAGPSVNPSNKTNQKEKRTKWTREDYSEVMYAFYMSLEKPSGNNTDNTFKLWRDRNPDVRLNMDSNKLANVRRDILKNKRLLDVELNEIKRKVNQDARINQNTNHNQQVMNDALMAENYRLICEEALNDIPLDEISDDDDETNPQKRNDVRYDDLDSHNSSAKKNPNYSAEREESRGIDDRLTSDDNYMNDISDLQEYISFKEDIIACIAQTELKGMQERENLNKVIFRKKDLQLLTMSNTIISEICKEVDLDLTDLNTVLYATAKTLETRLGIKPKKKKPPNNRQKKPRWKLKIENEVENMRSEISILTEIENGNNPKTRKSRKLKRKYKIKKVSEIKSLKEQLKQKMQAKAQRLRRYDKRSKFYRQNRIFESDAKKFYREIGKSQISINKPPDRADIEKFWRGIWEEEKYFNETAEWIENVNKETENVERQKWEMITTNEIKLALTKSQKWKSPGVDKVTNFWLNTFSSSHETLAKLLNNVMDNPQNSPEWLCEGTTYLLAKSEETENPKNFRPITCLSTTYKLLTSILTDRTYQHLEKNNLLPLEQKGCRRGSYGCKDQLLVNKMILENCRAQHRNMSCAWIDYKKAFDSVPHDWILRSLELFKISPKISHFLRESMKLWKTRLLLTHENGMITSDEVHIRRGIFQGDSLSPLLFCVSLIPLSLELNRSGYGYKIGSEKLSHLVFMDDLKLYGKNDYELEGLLKIVKGFSDDINMEFGLSKCAKATFKKGKMVKSSNINLNESTAIKDLEQEETYKYLGISEADGIQHASMKEKIKKELIRRTRSILKTELNSKNRVTAINTLAIPVVTYSFNIINWNMREIQKLDTKIRKLLTMNNMHHPKADVERLYLPRSSGGRGIVQLELSYKTTTIGQYRYLNLSQDWMLKLVLEHENRKKLHSVVKEAIKFGNELDVNLESEFENEIKATENARKLKQIGKKNGTKKLYDTWKQKPLHGQYALRSEKADVDLRDTHQWLRSAGLKAETEGFIIAAQDQSLSTRNFQANILHNGADPKCRICDKSTETIDHIVSGCSVLAPTEYKNRHDRVGQYIHWKVCKEYSIETSDNWYEHKPEPVVDDRNVTILWDFPIHTDRTIQANRPDIIIKDKVKRTCQMIDMSVPSDNNVSAKEFEKISKYKDLEIEVTKMWNMKTMTIPVIIGALGLIKKGTQKHIDKIPGNIPLCELQKIVLNSTAHILRRVLSI